MGEFENTRHPTPPDTRHYLTPRRDFGKKFIDASNWAGPPDPPACLAWFGCQWPQAVRARDRASAWEAQAESDHQRDSDTVRRGSRRHI